MDRTETISVHCLAPNFENVVNIDREREKNCEQKKNRLPLEYYQ